MTSMIRQQYSLIRAMPGQPNKPGNQEAEENQRTILNDWENKCIIATKEHSGVHKYTFHQPQISNNATHMVFKGELSVKLRAKDVSWQDPSHQEER